MLGIVAAIMSPDWSVFAQEPAAENSSTAQLAQSLSKQLKPHWASPKGQDYELLVTVLSWNLNPDGSLIGEPKIVYQSGITDENRIIAQQHAVAAIQAVKKASPFDLPIDQYPKWRRVAAYRFDARISDR